MTKTASAPSAASGVIPTTRSRTAALSIASSRRRSTRPSSASPTPTPSFFAERSVRITSPRPAGETERSPNSGSPAPVGIICTPRRRAPLEGFSRTARLAAMPRVFGTTKTTSGRAAMAANQAAS